MKNPVLLLYLGSDGISQHSAHFLSRQTWVPDPFSELPVEPLPPEQRHSHSYPCGEVAADYSGENCSKSLSINCSFSQDTGLSHLIVQ